MVDVSEDVSSPDPSPSSTDPADVVDSSSSVPGAAVLPDPTSVGGSDGVSEDVSSSGAAEASTSVTGEDVVLDPASTPNRLTVAGRDQEFALDSLA